MIVSFCFPHVVDVSALSICIVLNALVVVISMCLGSRVSPSIFGLMFMGSVMWNRAPNTIDDAKIKTNMKHIHTTIFSTYLNNRQHNKVTDTPPSNPSYPGPTQNKQMSTAKLIPKQNRRSQTPITTVPSL